MEQSVMRRHHSGIDLVTSADSFVEKARGWGRALEDREGRRSGLRLVDARTVVARRNGIAPGTLENLRNGRLKAIAVHVFEKLRAGVIRELEVEMRHLEHELQILRTTGVDPRENEVSAVVSSLAKVREALGLQSTE